jgi:hypothetical protein
VNTTIDELARRRQIRQQITQLRDAAIDWDIAVDDARAEVDRAVARLQAAVAQRDTAVFQLGLFVAGTAA